MLKPIFSVLFLAFSMAIFAQADPIVLPLWENGAPGFEDRKDEAEQAKDWWVKNVHNPSITVFLPEKPNGAFVLICPGGGHRELVFDEEGTKTAKFLNSIGVTAAVLKYRLFREENSPYTPAHPKEDVTRAMRLIRSNAAAWKIGAQRIGLMGFSAGGEVVNMIAFADNPGDEAAKDKVEQYGANPNFHIQIYPGPLGIPEEVDKNAVPVFLLAANRDECCSATIFQMLDVYRKAGAEVEAHFYAKAAHGFNMGDRSDYKTISGWPARLADWMMDYNFFE